MDSKYLFFDTETTDVQTKDIIQLAIVSSDGISLNHYFKPKHNISIGAMAVHHLTPEFLEREESFEATNHQGRTLSTYLKELSQKYIWVAHNAEFDLEVLQKKGIDIPKYICTFKLARNIFGEDNNKRDLESYSLQYLRYYLGLYKNEDIEHNTAHDALSDVYFVRDLFEYIQKNTKLREEDMITISKQPQFIRSINFGKYAGRTLEDIAKLDREYLEWLKGTASDKPDLLWNIERVLSVNNMRLFNMKRFYEAQALAIAMVVLVVSSIIAVSVYSRVLKDKGLSVEERASAEALEVSDLILDKVTTFSVNQLVDILRPENEDFPYEEGITLKEDGKNKTEIADLLVTLGIQNPFSDVGFCKTGDGNEYSLSIKAANANSPYEVRAGQIWSLPIKASVLPNGCTLNLKVGEGDSGAGFMIIKTYAKYTGDVATEYKEYASGDITNYCFSTDSSSCTNTNFNNDSWENYISPNSVITIPTTGSGTFKLEDIRLKAIGGNVAISYDMRDSSNVSCIQGFRMFEVKVSAFCDGVYRGKSILIPERKWSNALFDYSIFNGEGSL